MDAIDVDRVTAWIGERTGIEPPLSFELIPGGRSNMTFTVTDRVGQKLVLRRPPLGPLLPSAHDMVREHRLMAALADTPVPVPEMVGVCTDPEVNERDFYVMHHVDGVVVRDREIGEGVPEAQRTAMSASLVDTLCALHRVDVDEVGLGDLAKREGYIARQLKRWKGQWDRSKTRELPLLERVHAELVARVPEQGPATIAHGDYRLSNCMMAADGSVSAVLDWELCTLGDPMADLAVLQAYWFDEAIPDPSGDNETTGLPGFYTRGQLAERYATEMGRDLALVDYYLAWAYWRLACIAEGVYARYLSGQQGEQDEEIDLDQMRESVERRVTWAGELLGL